MSEPLSLWKQVSQWGRTSNQTAVANARAATVELSRRRVERQEVELFLAEHRPPVALEPRPA
jgi:hypothetical protein